MTDGLPFIIGNAKCLGRYHADVVLILVAPELDDVKRPDVLVQFLGCICNPHYALHMILLS